MATERTVLYDAGARPKLGYVVQVVAPRSIKLLGATGPGEPVPEEQRGVGVAVRALPGTPVLRPEEVIALAQGPEAAVDQLRCRGAAWDASAGWSGRLASRRLHRGVRSMMATTVENTELWRHWKPWYKASAGGP